MDMKQNFLIIVAMVMTVLGFDVKGQDRTVEIEGQTVIVLEGRKTDFSTPRRYIYIIRRKR